MKNKICINLLSCLKNYYLIKKKKNTHFFLIFYSNRERLIFGRLKQKTPKSYQNPFPSQLNNQKTVFKSMNENILFHPPCISNPKQESGIVSITSAGGI